MMNVAAIQQALREEKLDGWLFFDHHLRDPLAYRVLGFDAPRVPTRRWYYLIPATGMPRALVHAIEAYTSKLRKNPYSDVLAREALRLLAANLVTVVEDGKNREARQAVLFGANYDETEAEARRHRSHQQLRVQHVVVQGEVAQR